jgi:hypothetical protein
MSRSTQAEQTMLNALTALKQTYTTTAFRDWNAREFVTKMKIGGQLPTVLKRMKLIETVPGRIRLNESIMTVRPRTVLNAMNKYAIDLKTSRTKVQAPTVTAVKQEQESFDEIVIMLEKKIKEKVLRELLAKLS